jgi:hypothetical protein
VNIPVVAAVDDDVDAVGGVEIRRWVPGRGRRACCVGLAANASPSAEKTRASISSSPSMKDRTFRQNP